MPADCLAKYSADGATRHPPNTHAHAHRSLDGGGGGGAMCSQHLTQDKQFVSARREMANLAPNTAETPERQHWQRNRNRFGKAATVATEAPFGSRTAPNTYPVRGELFRRVSNAQLMRIPSRGSSTAAAAVDAVCAACGESAQCSRYSSPFYSTHTGYSYAVRREYPLCFEKLSRKV